ncbi:hypothetical protein [Roseococcus pinisoli]|uniref:Polysaccharide deacetylase n=1 Tax=Roseococcus pinisoli TaxID=2835040 RepID=A0ABS5QCF8_9PROT|nr:hypothetical protein [Roseococcus pinisoli]MBS7810650.1 hypothetical protein [Roseococcus pinisoli]
MLRKAMLAALCLAALHGPVAAQNGLAPLREAAEGLPAILAQNPEPFQMVFVDYSALAVVAGGRAEWPDAALRRIVLGSELPPLATLRRPADWGAAAGVTLQQLRSMAGVGKSLVVWRFDRPARLEEVMAHLRQRGFVEAAGGMLQDSGPIPVMDRMRDPWRSLRSAGVTVARQGDTLVQAPQANAVRLLTGPGESFAAEPVNRSLLEGVEAQLGEGRVVQALFFSPALGLKPGDPAALLNRDPGARLQLPAAGTGQGLPPYRRGLLVDVAGPDEAGLLVALAYPACVEAERAAHRLRERWSALGQAAPLRSSGRAVPEADGSCTASVLIEVAPAGMANPALDALWRAIQLREATPIDIG